MAQYFIEGATLTDIADAIREKEGTTALIDPADYAERISAITTGVDTSDATAAAGDILSGKTAYVNGTKLTGTITTQDAKTITPSASNQTAIAAETYASGAVTVLGDTNLVPENIVEGKNIFNVAGAAEPAAALATELSEQDNLIAEIMTALDGKTTGGEGYKIARFTADDARVTTMDSYVITISGLDFTPEGIEIFYPGNIASTSISAVVYDIENSINMFVRASDGKSYTDKLSLESTPGTCTLNINNTSGLSLGYSQRAKNYIVVWGK